jgi:hypothetical protein
MILEIDSDNHSASHKEKQVCHKARKTKEIRARPYNN